MAKVQFTISDEDRDRLVEQARQEGKTLSEWLGAAVRELLAQRNTVGSCQSRPDEPVDLHGCSNSDPDAGLDWRKYRDAILAWQPIAPIRSDEETKAFFKACDSLQGPGSEPDWEDVKEAMSDDLLNRLPDT